MSLPYEGESQSYGVCAPEFSGLDPDEFYTKAEIDALLALNCDGESAGSGIDESITSLTGGGAGSLNYLATFGSGAAVVGDRKNIDVATGPYEGERHYLLIVSAAAESLPSVVRPLDWASSGMVWEERL
jgi:hypothetical protein